MSGSGSARSPWSRCRSRRRAPAQLSLGQLALHLGGEPPGTGSAAAEGHHHAGAETNPSCSWASRTLGPPVAQPLPDDPPDAPGGAPPIAASSPQRRRSSSGRAGRPSAAVTAPSAARDNLVEPPSQPGGRHESRAPAKVVLRTSQRPALAPLAPGRSVRAGHRLVRKWPVLMGHRPGAFSPRDDGR